MNALQTWLRAGGRLIVGVEQLVYLNGNDWLRQLLPCEVTALGQVSDHSALQDWLTKPPRSGRLTPQIFRAQRSPMGAGVPGSPSDNPYGNLGLDTKFESMPMEVASVALRGGRVLIGSGTQPLAITGRRGRGEVIVLLFSPELEPFLSWANRPYFWARIADFPPELLVRPSGGNNYGNWGGLSLDGVFGAMIDSRQVRKLPVGWLLVLLLAYLVVIGPLDQWWLKKINRQMWTWITFPAYVALFSVLIYFIGYKLRAGETEYNELHLVDILPAGDQAEWHGSTYASLYSPANARYALVSDVPFSSLRGEYMGGWGSGNEASRASVEQRPAGFAAEVSVPVWTSQLFVGDWWRRGEAPLKVSLVPQGNGWQVEVENRTDQTISNAKLVIAQRLFNLGALPARRTSQFSTTKLASEDLSGFLQRQIGSFQSAAQQRRQAFSTGQGAFITDAASGAMAASFTSLLRPQDGYSQFISPGSVDLVPLLERGDAILLAWVPNWTPVKPMNRFSPRRSHRDTLLRVAVEPRPSLAEAIR